MLQRILPHNLPTTIRPDGSFQSTSQSQIRSPGSIIHTYSHQGREEEAISAFSPSDGDTGSENLQLQEILITDPNIPHLKEEVSNEMQRQPGIMGG